MPLARNSDDELCLGSFSLCQLAEHPEIGTPSYIYDVDGMVGEARELLSSFQDAPHLIAFAVKANTAGPILRRFAGIGLGADVVSGGELEVALACGVPPDKIVYSGVAKTDGELRRAVAIGERGILALQIESLEELVRIEAVARSVGRRARVSIRVNPALDLDALDTHAHIATGHDEAKFGVPSADVAEAVRRIIESSDLELVGLSAHVGSQFTQLDGYMQAARFMAALAKSQLERGVRLEYLSTGGGFGIDYGDGCETRPCDFVRELRRLWREIGLGNLTSVVEPGRSLVAAHAVLLARVIQRKVSSGKRWLIVDAGMNDLMRPALYQSKHRVVPCGRTAGQEVPWCVVGPVCESSDDFGVWMLPESPGDIVSLRDAGAYGFTMASQYNGRALPTEVFLEGGGISILRAHTQSEWVRTRVVAPLAIASPPR